MKTRTAAQQHSNEVSGVPIISLIKLSLRALAKRSLLAILITFVPVILILSNPVVLNAGNLLLNPGFETTPGASPPTSWTAQSGVRQNSTTQTQVYAGNYSMYITTDRASGTSYRFVSQNASVTAGQNYNLAAYVYNTAASTITLALFAGGGGWASTAGAATFTDSNSTKTYVTGSWAFMVRSTIPAAGISLMGINVSPRFTDGTAGTTGYFDNIYFGQPSSPTALIQITALVGATPLTSMQWTTSSVIISSFTQSGSVSGSGPTDAVKFRLQVTSGSADTPDWTTATLFVNYTSGLISEGTTGYQWPELVGTATYWWRVWTEDKYNAVTGSTATTLGGGVTEAKFGFELPPNQTPGGVSGLTQLAGNTILPSMAWTTSSVMISSFTLADPDSGATNNGKLKFYIHITSVTAAPGNAADWTQLWHASTSTLLTQGTTQYNWPSLPNKATYWWRIWCEDGAGVSSLSTTTYLADDVAQVAKFGYTPPPNAPSGLTQLAGTSPATTLTSMQWTNSSTIISSFTQSSPVAGDLKFHLQVSSFIDFSPLLFETTSQLIAQGTTGYQWPALINNGTYWWRAWSEDSNGFTSASTSTTLGVGGDAKLGFDNNPPGGISNLTAIASATDAGQVKINWTSPGDDGTVGNLTGTFRINYSSVGIVTSSNFTNTNSTFATVVNISTTSLVPLTACTTTFFNLVMDATYWFAIKTMDKADNWSVWKSTADDLTVNTSGWCYVPLIVRPSVIDLKQLTALVGAPDLPLMAWTNSSTIISSFTITDPQPTNTVKFYLWVSSQTSGTSAVWTPLVFATTSALLAQGTTGYQWPALTDTATYWWQVWAEDSDGITSSTSTLKLGFSGLPTAPSGLTAVLLGQTSIQWQFTDNANNEDGLFIATGTWPSNYWESLGQLTGTGGTTSWWQTNLSTNTQFTVQAGATNTFGPAWTSAVSTYTIAAVPAVFVATTTSSSIITLSWNANQNPDTTRYGIDRSTVPALASAITNIRNYASALTATNTTATGLLSATTYWFRVWAYNGDQVATAYSGTIASTTTAPTPPPTQTDIVISQVMVSTTSTYGEFVELYNRSASPVYLQTSVTRGNDTGALCIHISTGAGAPDGNKTITWIKNTIPAFGYFLIAATRNVSGVWPSPVIPDATYTSGTPILNQTAMVYISTSATADVSLKIDLVGLGTNNNFETKATTGPAAGLSVERLPGGATGNGTDTNNNLADFIYPVVAHPRNTLSLPADPDDTAPAGISNLTALPGALDGKVVLSWTSPGDDGITGDLNGTFRIKYSSVAIISAGNFDSPPSNLAVTTVDISTTTLVPLTACTTTLTLTPSTSYWFAMKTQDDNTNWSVWNSSADAPIGGQNTSAYCSAQDLTPAAPANLTSIAGDTQIKLWWTANSEIDISSYTIWCASHPPSSEPPIAVDWFFVGSTPTVSTLADPWIHLALTNTSTYYYRITAGDWTGHSSGYSDIISTIPYAQPPAVPSNLYPALVGATSIQWRFTDNANNEDGLYISTGPVGNPSTWISENLGPKTGGGTTSWWQLNLSTNTQYTVYAGATNAFGAKWTSAVSTYTLSVMPSNFAATTSSTYSINLAWSANTNPDPATRYGISRSTDSGFTSAATIVNFDSNLTAQTTVAYNLFPGTTYYFRLLAYNNVQIPTAYIQTSSATYPLPPHTVISQFATRGPTPNAATNEFVEIYNSSGASVDISGWRMQYSAGGAEWTTNVATVTGTVWLSTGSYYLFAHTNFSGSILKNCTYTFDTVDAGGHWRLIDATGNEIDKIGWGTAANPEGAACVVQQTDAGSVERLPGNPNGNSYDANNNSLEFQARARRIPRNNNSPVEPDSNWPSASAALTQKIKTYFNTPTYSFLGAEQSEAKYALLNLINSAQSYVYIAIYQQDDTEIATALKNRATAGVVVRVVVGDAAIPFAQTNYTGSSVKWRPKETGALMHSKFVVVDGRVVWTGSGNFDSDQPPTSRALTSQNNDFLLIQSTALAKNYEDEFKEMWWGYFGSYKQTSPTANLTIAGTSVENYYSPQNDPVNTTLRTLVQNAGESIFFSHYSFSVATLLDDDVQTAFSNGRVVQGIVDDSQSSTLYNNFNTAGITMRYLSGPGSEVQLHNKLMIIDQKKVVTGSTNLSVAGSSSNDENMLIIDDARIARQYVKYFKRVYELGIPTPEVNPPADITAPYSVGGALATPSGPGSISVQWNTYSGEVGDSGFSKYYVFITTIGPILNTTFYLANAKDDDNDGYVDEGQFGVDGNIIPEAAINIEGLTGTVLTTCGGSPLIDGTSYYGVVTAVDKWGNETLLGSGSIYGPVTSGGVDITPPGQIKDLVAYTGSSSGKITLQWTAVGDDAYFGLASAYDIRYSVNPIRTETDFNNATVVAAPPTPLFSGQVQSFEVSGLNSATQYYFAMKARDESNNWSVRSNLAIASTKSDAGVVINQFCYNGATETSDEWIELHNTSDLPININGWQIQHSSTISPVPWQTSRWTITLAGLSDIPARGFCLIGGINIFDRDFNSGTNAMLNSAPVGIRLRNSSGQEIDRVGYSGGGSNLLAEGTAAGTTGDNQSLKRDPDGDDTGNNSNDFIVVANPVRRNLNYAQDITAPSAITNLSALTGANPGEITLGWTAPGDDGETNDNVSPPAYYDLRYSSYAVTGSSEVWWTRATKYPSSDWPISAQSVSEQQTLVLSPGATYYFGMRTIDDAGNISDLDDGTVAYTQAFAKASTGTIGGQLVINEVAPSQYSSDGDDWIEFYNPGPTSPDIYGWKFFEIYDSTGTPFEKFEGNWNFPVGSYLVLRFNRARNMSSPVQISANSYEITTDKPGLTGPGTGTSGSSGIILQNNLGTWIDALFYTNQNNDISSKFDEAYSFATTNNQWRAPVGGALTAANYRYYDRNYSISRDEKSTDGTSPSDNEWHISAAPTPGAPTRGTQNWVPDTVVPSAVTDLVAAVGTNRGTIKLSWTATGDDGITNTAAGYIVKYSPNPIINNYDWDNAANYGSASRDNVTADIVWTPAAAASGENYEVGALQPGSAYYIAMKVEDEQGNSSLISNVVYSTASAIVGSSFRINEVAPLQASGQDWVEFYNATRQSINVNNWTVVAIKSGYYTETVIKTLPNITVGGGEYLVLNMNVTNSDETTDKGSNGWWDVYASVDLRGFEGVVALRDNGGTIIDFVAYSGGNAVDWSRVWATASGYLGAVQYHQWSPAGGAVADAFNWSGGAPGVTFGRNIDSVDTDDAAVSRDDWKVFSNPTKGLANDDILPGAITGFAAIQGANDGEIKLSWTTVGDDSYSGTLNGKYGIHYSSYVVFWTTASAQVTISTSGINPGVTVASVVNGLLPAVTYYFRIWAADEVNNWSTISVGATTYAQDLAPDGATNFTIYRSSLTKVDIRWQSPSPDPGDISYYNLYSTTIAGANPDAVSDLITSVLYPGTSHQYSVDENTTYYFFIRVYDTMVGNDAPTVLYSALLGPVTSYPSLTIPASPQNFSGAAVSNASIQWSWQDVSIGETGFRIYSSTGGLLGTVGENITSLTTAGLLINTTYAGYVRAYNAVGESSASNTAAKSTLANPPSSIVFTNITHNGIIFTFSPNNNPSGTRYGLSRSTNSEFTGTAVSTFVTYSDNFIANSVDVTGLLPSTTYWFRVWAYNQDGLSSGFVTSAATQTITGAEHIVISQFAFEGPAGGTDEFVELYNPTNSDVNISGWKLQYTAGSEWSTRTTVPSGKVIKSKGFYLFGYKDKFKWGIIPDAEFTTGANETSAAWRFSDNYDNQIDCVGYGSVVSTNAVEGTPISTTTVPGAVGSFYRKPGSPNGAIVDTDNNAVDFSTQSVRRPRSSQSPKEPDNNWPAALTSAESINYYFTPASAGTSQPKTAILNLINGAQSYIYVSIYTLTNNDIINALNNKANFGVVVRVIVDPYTLTANPTLASKFNWNVKWCSSQIDSPIMHHKFIVVDGRSVQTGSVNFTEGGLQTQDNDCVIINSTGIASIYQKEFEAMWWGYFKDYKKYYEGRVSLVSTSITLADRTVPIEIRFSPNIQTASSFASLIGSAKESILFDIYTFTNNTIADAILSAKNRGLVVQGVFDRSQVTEIPSQPYGAWDLLGMNVRKDNNPNADIMHSKLMVIDNDIVVSGSFNWTVYGDTKNDENQFVIYDRRLARQFIKYHKRVYGLTVNEDTAESPSPDATAPSNIAGLSAYGSNAGAISANWNSSTASDFSRYYVFVKAGSAITAADLAWDGTLLAEKVITNAAGTGTTLTTCQGSPLVDGSNYYIAVLAMDKSGNESGLVQVGPVQTGIGTDTTPPSSVNDLTASAGSTHGDVLLSWTATGDDWNTGIASKYDIRYSTIQEIVNDAQFNSATKPTDIPEPLPAGLTQTFTIRLPVDVQYYFAMKAIDDSNNSSGISNIAASYPKMDKVVINEFVYDPSGSDGGNEWVELYNTSASTINLTGWQMERTSKTNWSSPSTMLTIASGNIKPGGYFLLSQSTGGVQYVAADSTYSATSTMYNSASSGIRLKHSNGDVIDTVGYAGSGSDSLAEGYSAAPSVSEGSSLTRSPDGWDTNINSSDFAENKYPTPVNTNGPDIIPPSAIADLSASTGAGAGEVNIDWTAPGNDGMSGNNTSGAKYIIKYATYSVTGSTVAWWSNAITYYQEWSVGAQGATETKTLKLSPGFTYWFAIRTVDGSGNISALDAKILAGGAVQSVAVAKAGSVGSSLRINEAAPSQLSSDGNDWLEIYNPQDTVVNLQGLKFYESYYSTTTPFENFEGDWSLPAKNYLVLRFNQSVRNMTTPVLKGTNYYECYTDKSGLTDSDDVIAIVSSNGAWLDAVCYSDRSGSLSGATNFKAMYNTAVANGEWPGPTATGSNNTVVENARANVNYITRNRSLGRDDNSTDGTNPAQKEWHILAAPTPGSPTMGQKNRVPDTVLPSQVTTLIVSQGINRGMVKITWTSPGDDGVKNTAAGYVLKYAKNSISDISFDTSKNWDNTWVPSSPNRTETKYIGMLTPGQAYYFALKTEDEQPNLSLMSNTASGVASDRIGSYVRLNELVPMSADGKDWVEIYNAYSSTVSLFNWKLYGLESGDNAATVLKTFQNTVLPIGGYLVVNFNLTGADETTADSNGNGYYDAYASYDLRGFEGVLYLADADGNMVDFVAYSQGQKAGWDTVWTNAVNFQQWSPATKTASAAADWSGGNSSKSLGRDALSSDSDDTVYSRNDWTVYSYPTKGFKNNSAPPARIADLSASSGLGEGYIGLTWTAPGDDDIAGTLVGLGKYQVKYATYPVSTSAEEWWSGIPAVDWDSKTNPAKGTLWLPVKNDPGGSESDSITGLYPGITYFVAIKTQDGIGNISLVSSISSATAFNTNPMAPTWTAAPFTRSAALINIYWNNNSELDILNYDVQYSSSVGKTLAPVFDAASTTIGTTFIQDISANPGWWYYYRIKARDKTSPSALESGWSSTIALSPDMSPPTIVSRTVVNRIYLLGNVLTVQVTVNDNTGSIYDSGISTVTVKYRWLGEASWRWAAMVGGTLSPGDISPGQLSFQTIRLTTTTSLEYYIEAKDVAGNGVISSSNTADITYYQFYTPPSPDARAYTVTVKTEMTSSPDASGKITISDGNVLDGEVSIQFVDGSRPNIKIKQFNPDDTAIPSSKNETEISSSWSGTGGNKPVCVFEFTPSIIFKKPAILTLLYFDIDNSGIVEKIDGTSTGLNEADLRLYYWDGMEWRYVGGKVDTTNNTVTVSVNHFTFYALFPKGILPIKPQAKEKFITPDNIGPVGTETINFQASSDISKIEIYDITGKKLRTLDGVASWNGRDDDGNPVESGVYIYRVETESGKVNTGAVVVAK